MIELDELTAEEAAPLLTSCCGARAWLSAMLDQRPFGDVATLLRAADELWWSLGPDDWREAFAHHPRIGERGAAVTQDARAQAWSAREQAAVRTADADVQQLLSQKNALYERRFGHIYIVAASGKTAAELLAILEARLANDPETELRVAASEQAKIMRLRLLKLLDRPEGSQ